MYISPTTILAAEAALSRMDVRCDVPYRTVRAISSVRALLHREANTIREHQRELISRYGGAARPMTGEISFPDRASADAFGEAWGRFVQERAQLDVEPVDLSAYADYVNFGSIDVDLDALSRFIDLEVSTDG